MRLIALGEVALCNNGELLALLIFDARVEFGRALFVAANPGNIVASRWPRREGQVRHRWM